MMKVDAEVELFAKETDTDREGEVRWSEEEEELENLGSDEGLVDICTCMFSGRVIDTASPHAYFSSFSGRGYLSPDGIHQSRRGVTTNREEDGTRIWKETTRVWRQVGLVDPTKSTLQARIRVAIVLEKDIQQSGNAIERSFAGKLDCSEVEYQGTQSEERAQSRDSGDTRTPSAYITSTPLL
ncbi:hypothetical protein C8R44DRAFT_988201 [Mycena epipterygia]|nr:hypothetical protein C8R44DRAFT_988201 [Mycena epipterygia]